MRAVVVHDPGGVDALELETFDDPVAGPGEVVVEVAATAVNRADVMQRQGHYAPPPGASHVLGLECSGTVAELGAGVTGWAVGDEVCALLSGGGYADKVAVPAGQVAPIPSGVDLVEAGAIMEVAATVWSNVFMAAALQPDETLLVHGGGSGVGTMAVQLASALGARVAVTAGSSEKLAACRSLGADITIDYHRQDFVAALRDATEGRGANVILDNMGAAYLARNIEALATAGRLVVIGLQGGRKAELDLGTLLAKRGAVVATSLRARPVAEKSAIVASLIANVWPLFADGSVRPIVHATYALADVRRAHQVLEDSSHVGKVVLTP